MSHPPLSGYATPDGTERFKARAEKNPTIADGHFRSFQNLSLSTLGMGSYLGQPTQADDAQVTAAVRQSVISGAINVIDTAINYRLQRAERAIGEALRQLQTEGVRRDELFIASKNGFLTPDADISEDFKTYFTREYIDTGIVDPRDVADGMHCMSPSYLDNQLQRSLDNLGVQTLDLMYLHNAAESQIPDDGKELFMARLLKAFQFYEQARQAGKIRYYGMATWTCFRVPPEDPGYISLLDVVTLAHSVGGENHGFRFIQLPFNFGMAEALTMNTQPVFEGLGSTLEAAQAFGVGVFTSVPLLQGQLLDQPLPRFEGLNTSAQTCLQFVRSTPGIIAPLVGQKQPVHVSENLAVAAIPPIPFEALQAILAGA